jgi:ADP-ribose pyrophosphatase
VIRPTDLKFQVKDKVVASFGTKGWLKVILRTVEHVNFDGDWMKYTFRWIVIDRGESVGILIHDTTRDEIILVEQFRPAIKKTTFEIVAGMVKRGEDAIACVRREVKEEVGLDIDEKHIFPISSVYLSPGASNERVFLYYAVVSSLDTEGMIHGLKSEGECIRKHIVSVDEAMKMVEEGIIEDAKTALAISSTFG